MPGKEPRRQPPPQTPALDTVTAPFNRGAPRRPTLKDVARRVGVDPSLVSRAVNDDPRSSASEATRRRILEAVEELGYSPSAMGRALRSSRSLTMGMLLPDISNPMYQAVVTGAEKRAEELGYGIALGIHVEGAREATFLNMLRESRVDGLLVASGVLTDEFLAQVGSEKNGPMVFVNRRVKGVQSSVVVDDAAGARMAVQHLAELGHRRVLGLFGPRFVETSTRRRRGFLDACKRLELGASTLELTGWRADDGYRGALEAFAGAQRPTAVFASTLTLGLGVLRASHEMGLEVPNEVSVISLHDNYVADFLFPALTTVRMPSTEMGAAGVDQLVSIIQGGEHRQVILRDRPQLIVRASTARRRPADVEGPDD